MLIDIPYIHCWVYPEYLGLPSKEKMVEAYAFSVTSILNRPLLFTVHTIHGAVYSRLPIEALKLNNKKKRHWTHLQPWSCLSDKITCLQHQYLKDYNIESIEHGHQEGRYLMTFDFNNGGFSEDPEQHKTMNLVAFTTGELALLPNNMLIFNDAHFVKEQEKLKLYRRNTKYYTIED